MEHHDVGPLKTARGTIKLPGSKSISNRVLLLAALAQGETVVRELLVLTTRGSCGLRSTSSVSRSSAWARTITASLAPAAASRTSPPIFSWATPVLLSAR